MDTYLIGKEKVAGVEEVTDRFIKYYESKLEFNIARKLLLNLGLVPSGELDNYRISELYRKYSTIKADINTLVNIMEGLSILDLVGEADEIQFAACKIFPMGRAVLMESSRQDLPELYNEIKGKRGVDKNKEELTNLITQAV